MAGISNKINMKYLDESPRRQVLLRLPWPHYNDLKNMARHNGISITEMARHCFWHGYNLLDIQPPKMKRSEIILERARKQSRSKK